MIVLVHVAVYAFHNLVAVTSQKIQISLLTLGGLDYRP
jgi:hypothetical protein